jgi:hypothetical protein
MRMNDKAVPILIVLLACGLIACDSGDDAGYRADDATDPSVSEQEDVAMDDAAIENMTPPANAWPCPGATARDTGQREIGPDGGSIDFAPHRLNVLPRPDRIENFRMRRFREGYVRVHITPSGKPAAGAFELTLSTAECAEHPAAGDSLIVQRRSGNRWETVGTGMPSNGGVYTVTVTRNEASSYALVAP